MVISKKINNQNTKTPPDTINFLKRKHGFSWKKWDEPNAQNTKKQNKQNNENTTIRSP